MSCENVIMVETSGKDKEMPRRHKLNEGNAGCWFHEMEGHRGDVLSRVEGLMHVREPS